MSGLIGKFVGGNLYVHLEATPYLTCELKQRLSSAIKMANITPNQDFNAAKFSSETRVSLLNYSDFFDCPFPPLTRSWVIDLEEGQVRCIDYRGNDNPHILHRKELLLPRDHPRWTEYAVLTELAESAGLFDDTQRIGYKQHWEQLLQSRGLYLDGHVLVSYDGSSLIARHRTALTRLSLSVPFQLLLQHNYLSGKYSVFDYGCGKGSDVRLTEDLGVQVSGWDPYYKPDAEISRADVVNLGYVINVIERPTERREVLLDAAALAVKVLVVSAMLEKANRSNTQPRGDGLITSRNTFQKYYTQEELKHYIEVTLSHPAIAVAPGIFFIFFDEEEEQRFLEARQRRKIESRAAIAARERAKLLEEHGNTLDELWRQMLLLGRKPREYELSEFSEFFESVGGFRKGIRLLFERFDEEELDKAGEKRQEDILVYLALNEFAGRRKYRRLPPRLQEDIKVFFGGQRKATEAGKHLLFKVSDSELIREACEAANRSNYGHLEEDNGLIVQAENVSLLAPILRVYVGVGLEAYGDVSTFDLTKIHIDTGKLTLIVCDDFFSSPLPRMVERVKVNLAKQRIDFFDYIGPFEPPYIFLKSRFLTPDQPHYQEQVTFDEEMRAMGIESYGAYGPNPRVFGRLLAQQKLELEGFSLVLEKGTPDLDDPCGRYFRFRDFIECGETQTGTRISNIPKQKDSYESIAKLARSLIDPVVDYFGSIKLTYGFCSQELAKAVPGRIAPKLDQHAACETGRNGKLISGRGGAAVDFIIPDESMLEVAQWIVAYMNFDRLYYYGDDKPVHVSVGPEDTRQVVVMKPTKQGKLRPQVVTKEKFLAYKTDGMEG